MKRLGVSSDGQINNLFLGFYCFQYMFTVQGANPNGSRAPEVSSIYTWEGCCDLTENLENLTNFCVFIQFHRKFVK